MVTGLCIIWSGPSITTHGNTYGRLTGRKLILAHRVAYENAFGRIPKDLVIDHLCRNGLCVNPLHLEAVSNVVNIMRGNGVPAINARKTHCKRRHALTPDNIWQRKNRRACKLCDKLRLSFTKCNGGYDNDKQKKIKGN